MMDVTTSLVVIEMADWEGVKIYGCSRGAQCSTMFALCTVRNARSRLETTAPVSQRWSEQHCRIGTFSSVRPISKSLL